MPFNFYAETSFIEMCGRGYFGVRISLRPAERGPACALRGRRRWSVSSLTSSIVSNVLCSVID